MFVPVSCQSQRVDTEEISRVLDYLQYYATFKIQLVETHKDTLFLTRPYEKGRIVPIPGIWNDYLNVVEWVYASKVVDTYISDVEKVIRCISGGKAIVWQVDSSRVPALYNFRTAGYTLHHFLASLKYRDRLGFQECFSDSLRRRFREENINVYDQMSRLIRPAEKLLEWRVLNDSTFAISTAQEGAELLLRMARYKNQWKISSFQRISARN